MLFALAARNDAPQSLVANQFYASAVAVAVVAVAYGIVRARRKSAAALA